MGIQPGNQPDTFELVHTDINHSNYFVDDSGGVTVFDFDDAH
ncbi:MAG: aminoglycoside phosphotransferase family protein [Dehalococcoidia bacterium]|nr:aminoglycoside phosphotransferase family protein [Dehalococcoidia bacterium]